MPQKPGSFSKVLSAAPAGPAFDDHHENSVRARTKDVIGKFWNAPNTALGLGYGLTTYLLGQIVGTHPHIYLRNNGVQFTGSPIPGGAITLGNTTTWSGDPYGPPDGTWYNADGSYNGKSDPIQYESRHTIQGQQFGPAYLPSNILGGIWGLLRDGDWHGDSNWNEVGPQRNPPKPW